MLMAGRNVGERAQFSFAVFSSPRLRVAAWPFRRFGEEFSLSSSRKLE
jgi:hypothetical protein